MRQVFVDTNVFLRFLTADEPKKFQACKKLFTQAVEGGISLITPKMVIAELIWTLLSYYKVSKTEVVEKIIAILNTPNLYIPNKDLISETFLVFERKDVDYIDAYNAVFMRYQKVEEIYSYDRDFDVIEGIKRIEP